MDEPIAVLDLRVLPDGRWAPLSPGPGWWSGFPQVGALLGPGSTVGWFDVRNRRYRLVMPDGTIGRVVGRVPVARRVAVEYGQPLLELAHVDRREESRMIEALTASRLGHDPSLPEGCRALVAPTEGVFYRRPSPDAAPFVEPGDRVVSGQAIGLVEVMKTFNQIVYGGPGFAESAEVVEFRAADAEEVGAGQILVVLR